MRHASLPPKIGPPGGLELGADRFYYGSEEVGIQKN